MIPLHLQALDDRSISLKGLGRNQRLEPITVDKIPGSILLESYSYSVRVRIYCIFDDYLNNWVFAFTSEKEHYNQKPLDFMIDQKWDKAGRCKMEVYVPIDTTITLEGEFAEDQ